MPPTFRPGAVLLTLACCAACGLKGPLYLPDRATNVAVRPAPAAGAPQTTDTPAPAGNEEGDPERRRDTDHADPTTDLGD